MNKILILAIVLLAGIADTAWSVQQDPQQLAVWNDPRFKQRFIESYAAETDVEPRLTAEETKRMLEIQALMAEDKVSEALQLVLKTRTPASSAAFDFMLGGIRFQRDEFVEAAAAFQAAVDKHPKFVRAWRNLGFAHARLENYTSALPAFTRLIALGEADAFVYGMTGYGYLQQSDDLAAESAYRMANLLDPTTLRWKLGLTQSLLRQQRYAEVVSLASALIAKYPDNDEFWMLQAKAFLGMAQPLRAAENLEIVNGLGKSTAESLVLLGDIYVNERLFLLAAGCYADALARSGVAGVARAMHAARDLAARGAIEESSNLVARLEAEHGRELQESDRIELLRLKARIAVAAGGGPQEAAILAELLKLNPMDGAVLLQLGRYERLVGNAEQAMYYFIRASKLEEFEADASVGQAQVLVDQGKYAEAVPLLRRAQQVQARESVQQFLEQVERFAKSRS